VQVAGSQPTAGAVRRQAEADGGGWLIWRVGQLAVDGREQLALTLAPRHNRGFDLSVDWTSRPCSSSAPIEVQQPKLEMSISGAKDILYGDAKVYTITLVNPGTGDAEGVLVNLAPGGAGESRRIGVVPAGGRKDIEVELAAQQAGLMQLRAVATADGGLRAEAALDVLVRRADLHVRVEGPGFKFAGATAVYQVRVANVGDAAATEVAANVVLPAGARLVADADDAPPSAGGSAWRVGTLQPGGERQFEVRCELSLAGENRLTVQADAAEGVAASDVAVTCVEAIADLKLTVNDPQGPKPIGKDVVYELQIANRGTKAAQQVSVIAQFSEGIEPVAAEGGRAEIVPGQVLFHPVARIEAGQEVTLRVKARAETGGNHVFRAEVKCGDPETRLAAEDSTRFFADDVPKVATRPATRSEDRKR
jgi:hypothetical protein